jgi:hypothetical protein
MKSRALWLLLSLVMLALAALVSVSSIGAIPEDGDGVAVFDPPLLHAAQEETFRLIYTVGPGGFPVGSQFKVKDAHFHGMGWTQFQLFQTGDDQAEGYLTVDSSKTGVTLSVDRVESSSVQDLSFTVVTLESGSLAEGDTIILTYGDTSASPSGAATTPHKAYQQVSWLASTDTDGDGIFARLALQPALDIAPDPDPVHMFATGPTYIKRGEAFDLAVRVLDVWGNPCIDYGGVLSFSSTDGAAVLPPDTPLPPGTGLRRFPITFNTNGIHYAYIDDGSDFNINSNPIVVVDELPEDQIFWGDLHGHHGHVYSYTVGVSPTWTVRVDEYLEYARDVSDLDFACESHKSSAYWNVPEVHREIADSILQYESAAFVPFRGFEWMGKQSEGEGHHNIYYLAADGPYYSPDDPASDSLDELYRLVEGSGLEALVIPHAPSYSGSDWFRFDAEDLNATFRRQAEIYSHWDLSEELDPGSVRAGWLTGNRMGTTAATDGHYCFPGVPLGDVCEGGPGGPTCEGGRTVSGGLAAVQAPHLTRQHLWQGLKQRHTYGTDGMRIFLDFSADDRPMGEQYRTTTAPHLQIVAAGTAEIEMVQVFRGTYAEVPANPGDTEDYYTTIYTDTPAAMTTAFDIHDTGFTQDCFYYVRVTQVDGRRAWSSPIWVDYGLPPLDLWQDCGDGTAGSGENLATCAPDTQFSQASELTVIDGTPRLSANGVSIPATGLYLYNVTNVDSYVPYNSEGWLEFMERQVDRVKFAGGHYLGFSAFGTSLYDGPAYPTVAQMDNPAHWNWDMLDSLFDYAAQQGVYLIPTVNADNSPPWWLDDNPQATQTDHQGTVWVVPTFNNPDYWQWADPLLSRFIAHYRDHPALLAWDCRVGQGENNYAPPYTGDVFDPPDTWCDYSPQALDNFRGWLTAKYGTDAALQAAWISPTVTLATAQIPYPQAGVTPTTLAGILLYANGPGDVRPNFYDWHHFRMDEKTAEMAHFAALFRNWDPDHILFSDPAYVPLDSGNRLRWGTIDGETIYRSPDIDAVVRHPRVGHSDQAHNFNTSRMGPYMTDQYAVHHGKLSSWANEETSEVIHPAGDQENIWRLGSFAAMHAAMGQGDGWVTGSVTDTMLPAWSDGERAEIRRLAGLYTAPGLRSPQPRIAILADPLGEVFDYYVEGALAASSLRGSDTQAFLDLLWQNGLTYDILTVDDVQLDPDRLSDFEAILVLNQLRLPLAVAQQLAAYRDGGGGLFIGGRTGIFDELGKPDDSALEELLAAPITGEHNTGFATWDFETLADPLLFGLQGAQYAADNLYHIPVFDLGAAGYTRLGHLADAPLVATAGYQGRTVFWFPRLTTTNPDNLIRFLLNLWEFWGIAPIVSATGAVEAAGDNYLTVYSPLSQTVLVGYAPEMSGALVWDWNAMEMVGPVPDDSQPGLALHLESNATAFLGTFWPDAGPNGAGPQLVAVSGASLASTEYRLQPKTFAVALYRAVPGLQVQVAVHLGEMGLKEVRVQGGGLDHAGYERSGDVYVVRLTPTEERVTVSFVGHTLYLPVVIRDS